MLSKTLIEKINKLRSKGFSYPEISYKLKIPRTTVYEYGKNVKIKPEYINAWLEKRKSSAKRKLLKEKLALIEAKKILGTLTKKERILFLSALYWAEGSKNDFGLSNTDPRLISVFINSLKSVFGVNTEDLRISIRIYEDLNKEECLKFWSKTTGVSINNFCSVNLLSGKKNGKLKYGMCRVRVSRGGDLLKKINAINKVLYMKCLRSSMDRATHS